MAQIHATKILIYVSKSQFIPHIMVMWEDLNHDDVIKWKHFPRYWPSVREIHRSPVNSPHKGQWHGALMFLWPAPWINDKVNNREAGDLRRHHAHYDIIVMNRWICTLTWWVSVKKIYTWGTYLRGYAIYTDYSEYNGIIVMSNLTNMVYSYITVLSLVGITGIPDFSLYLMDFSLYHMDMWKIYHI